MPTKITIHITIHSWSSSHHHVFFLPRSCWLGCYRLGLEQQKSRRIDREMETDGFFALHFIGTGRGCFCNQEKIDASAVQDFFSERPYIQKKKVGQGFFSKHDRDVDLLYFGLCFWSFKSGTHKFVIFFLNGTFSVDVPNLWGLNIIRRGSKMLVIDTLLVFSSDA